MKKVICIGSATKDLFVALKETRIIDNPNEITSKKLMGFEFGAKIYAEEYREGVGGSAVNVGAGMLSCGLKPFVFSRTSKSDSGKWIIKKISRMGLKKNYIQQNGKRESEISIIISDKENKDHVIMRTGDSVELFDIEKALSKFREKTDLVYVGSQKKGWHEEFPEIANFTKRKRALLAMNPSSYQIESDSEKIIAFLSEIDVLLLNRDEAIEIIQNTQEKIEDDVPALINQFIGLGARMIVITDGSEGAYVSSGEGIFHVPTLATDVVDTVGAGDAFASGFLSSLVEGNEIQESLLWGVANSAGTISERGAVNGLLKKKDLKKIAQENSQLINKIS